MRSKDQKLHSKTQVSDMEILLPSICVTVGQFYTFQKDDVPTHELVRPCS